MLLDFLLKTRNSPIQNSTPLLGVMAERKAGSESGWRSLQSIWQEQKPFKMCSLPQPLIQANKMVTGGITARPNQSRRQLQSICGPQRMEEEHASGHLPNLLARLNLRPLISQPGKELPGLVLAGPREDPLTPETRKSRVTLDRCRPPGHNRGVFLCNLFEA